ncbi:rhoGAP domain-containing protein [Phthorimaea operculella]|nr:rhoGAP domain-containing protein [Phthorimaea operculella]
MAVETASWIPAAVASTLRDARSSQPVIAWLSNIRDSIEEYDPLITVRPPSPESSESETSTSPDSAFDEILSQLGKEIFKLDEYQRNLAPDKEVSLSLSILNIFDKCLESMKDCNVEESVVEELKPIEEEVKLVNGEESDAESTLSDVSFVTSTPAKSDNSNDMNGVSDKSLTPPVPPRRTKFFPPVHDVVECNNNIETKTQIEVQTQIVEPSEPKYERLVSDSDSESTCWSYKECSTDGDDNEHKPYAAVWSHSTGYHNSDAIMRRVLSQHYATVSRISFDTASDFSPSQYSVYSLQEVGDRCASAGPPPPPPVAAMTPDKPTDDGYEPVRDALTDEHIYEDINYNGCSYTSLTDEGCSCGGSVEVESISISASSEGVGRESPLYANLRDHDAYAVTPDVIFWKNLLFHPDYCEDEEDEWITPEECAVYSRDQRPPLVIPRITQYRKPREEPIRQTPPIHSYNEESPSQRHYGRLQDWSPTSERSHDLSFSKSSSDSPPLSRINKRFGGSTENLLLAERNRRPNHLQIPASSSGDSLDVEVRDKEPGFNRTRKVRSMVAPKNNNRMRSPVPAPRSMVPHIAEEAWSPSFQAAVLHEGPVKRTKFFESGKKVSKKWIDCYMVLTPTALYFYKDFKTYNATKIIRPPGTPPSPSAPRAELVLPLKNAHALHCIQNHTKRYTKSIVLQVNYDQYLLQDETEEGAKTWLKLIQNVYYKLGPKTDEDQSLNPSSNTDIDSLGRTPPVSRHINRFYQRAGGSSNEEIDNTDDSAEVSKSHVKRRLRNFFAKRPTMDSLVRKGIWKDEQVFGRKLEEVCPATSPRVPEFVVRCVKEIESNEENMCTDGLYRASGNLSQVQKIRLEVDQNNMSVIQNNTDIHVLTGSLKLFFRELKEPLIPCAIFDRILAACLIQNNTDIHVLTGSLKLFFRELKEPLIPCAIFDRILAACLIQNNTDIHVLTGSLKLFFRELKEPLIPCAIFDRILAACLDQNNMSVIQNNTDIHVLTGSLKLFFRELKEPLIPCAIFDRILAACLIQNNTDIHVLTGSLKLFFRELKEPLIPCAIFDRILAACLIQNNTDIHVLTGSLKLFFRELKEPLIPCAIFDRILAACLIQNNTDIHVLTGSLKLFFRELKEPLIPCAIFDRILAACLIQNNTDIHVLTGSLKLFFRELKEPLIPCAIFDRILAACLIQNNTDIHVLTGSLKLFFRELKEPLIPCAIFDRILAACLIQNNTDIHVLTGSLKLFFRELKEPLIPCAIFDRILAACSIKPREAKIKEFRNIVHALPQCNRETLKFLLEHLLRVTMYSESNRMHTANLAIVFGPTLLWAPAEQAHNIAIDCIQQNHFLLLDICDVNI